LRRLKDTPKVIAHGYGLVDAEMIWAILADYPPEVVGRVRLLLDDP
jgi:hypothetical protein